MVTSAVDFNYFENIKLSGDVGRVYYLCQNKYRLTSFFPRKITFVFTFQENAFFTSLQNVGKLNLLQCLVDFGC